MFSPSFATSSTRLSSSSPAASGPSALTASRRRRAKAANSSLFETGSVSQPTATIAPRSGSTLETTVPSEVSRPARLPASARPCSRRSRVAASRSPFDSTRARLQSIIPAPVWSRSCLTSAAGISVTGPPLRPRARAALRRRRAARPSRRRSAPGPARSAAPRRRGHLLGGDLRLPGLDGFRDHADDETAGTDRVVVARDDVVGVVGIAVRVHERDDRQPEPARLPHGELLLAQVDDEDRVGKRLHVGDAAEVRLELLGLAEHGDALLGGEQLELALGLEPPQLVQALDALRDRAPVGQEPAEPAVVHVRHADPRRLLGDGILALLLRPDEQDGAAP